MCGEIITPTLYSTIDSPSPLTCTGTRTYTYTYTDCAGLSSEWQYGYTIQHSTAPVVPDNGGTTVECFSSVVPPTPPTVYDVCGQLIVPTFIVPRPINMSRPNCPAQLIHNFLNSQVKLKNMANGAVLKRFMIAPIYVIEIFRRVFRERTVDVVQEKSIQSRG